MKRCRERSPHGKSVRIFAGGIATETNSFSLLRTGLEDFQVSPAAGKAGGDSRLDLGALWDEQARREGCELVIGPYAWANPAGPTLRSAYEALRKQLLEALRDALPVDVVLLMLHGAMIADGYPDCEADLLQMVRSIVGHNAIIGVELDLHAHVRPEKIDRADIVIAYKEYPHTDIAARARELLDLCLAAHRGEAKPVMAMADCKMVGQFPTSSGPLREFVDAMIEAEKRPGILSVSFFHGFRLGDVPHLGAKLLVVADRDQDLAAYVAEEFAQRVFAIRRDISFASRMSPVEEALSRAATRAGGPVVVADQADNPGSGGPGDSTFALQWLVENRVDDCAMALIYDPQVVAIACKAGVGASLCVRLGGKMGVTSGQPVDLDVTVAAVAKDYRLPFPQADGQAAYYRAGNVVRLRHGGLDILVNDVPVQCYSADVFVDLGIDPSTKKLLVIKSAQHFYGSFAPIASEIIYMSSPGAAPADPRLIQYRYFDPTGFYPWTDLPVLSKALRVLRA